MITVKGQVYDGVMIKPDIDDLLEHHGVKGMKWGVRRRQLIKNGYTRRMARRQIRNEKRGNNQDVTKNRYHVVTKRNGKSYIADESGRRMRRSDYMDMKKSLKKSLKNSKNKDAYRDFKRTEKASKARSSYAEEALGLLGANFIGSDARKIASQKMNTDVVNYTNKYLADLRKKKS